MKKTKYILCVLLLLCVVLLLVACNSKTVVKAYVNENMHAVIEYSDGTVEDLGYVGVEVEKEVVVEKEIEVPVEVIPPKYTVTYLNRVGETIKVEAVYKGDRATPPIPPEIPDHVFIEWNCDLSSVQGNMLVSPIYAPAATYTVTFLDENGDFLSTDTVIHGHAATAPVPPKRSNTIFDAWDTEFDSVMSELTVRAIYREKEIYTVSFLDYTGAKLAEKTVKETDTVEAPGNPTRDGYIFTGWSSSLSNITSDKTVVAQYRIVSGENIFDISYSLKEGGRVSMTVSVQGNVCLAGIQGEMKLPFGVTEVSVSASGETLANIEGNTLYYTFVSATNVTKPFALFTVTFRSTASTLSFDLGLGADDVFDQNGNAVSFKVIGAQVKVK